MKKSITKRKTMLLTMAAAIGLASVLMAGCSKSDKEENTTQGTTETAATAAAKTENPQADSGEYAFTKGITLDSPGTVNIFAFKEGKNYDKVIKKFEDITKDSLKTKLNFQWATNIRDEQALKLAEQGDIDLIFDAGWVNMASNLSQGMYQDLSKYFNNADYPGLQKAFSPEIVEMLKNPSDGAIYGIPFFSDYNNLKCMYIRGDWREKLGCKPVVDLDTFEAYLKAVDENKAELGAASAIGLENRGFYYFLDQTYEHMEDHIFEVPSTGARVTQYANVLLNDTNDEVLDVLYVGDPDTDFQSWPTKGNFLNEKTLKLADPWGKYVNADAITSKDAKEKFKAGLYGATENDLNQFVAFQNELKKTDPNAKLEYWIYDKKVQDKEQVYTNVDVSNNYLFMPYFNDDPDRAMAVLDWVFENQANNDLFSYGIEGEDFERVGDHQYKSLEPDNKYDFPNWLFSLNPLYIRTDADTPADIVEYYEWSRNPDNFKTHPFAGFSFNTEPVSFEYTAFTTAQQDYYQQFMIGYFGNETEAKLKEFYDGTKDYSTAIKEQVKEQLNTYFLNKK